MEQYCCGRTAVDVCWQATCSYVDALKAQTASIVPRVALHKLLGWCCSAISDGLHASFLLACTICVFVHIGC